jgi:hypothetical protein
MPTYGTTAGTVADTESSGKPRAAAGTFSTMRIVFRRVSNTRHSVEVIRADGTRDVVELDSKDFLRHDLAHLALEMEAPLVDGVWGSVARGGRLDGWGLDGREVAVAERVAGPLQTIMRTEGSSSAVLQAMRATVPELATEERADRIHARARALTGHWKATRFGEEMIVEWPFG